MQKGTLLATQKIQKKALETALRECDGNITATSRRMKVTRKAVYEAIQRYNLQHVLDECREELLDVAENSLHTLIRDGHASSVFFYLRTMGRDRGYSERVESTGLNGGPIAIQSIDVPPRAKTIEEWIGNKNRLEALTGNE